MNNSIIWSEMLLSFRGLPLPQINHNPPFTHSPIILYLILENRIFIAIKQPLVNTVA